MARHAEPNGHLVSLGCERVRVRREAALRGKQVGMLEMMQLIAGTNWIVLAFAALIFDIPRYTFFLAFPGASRADPKTSER